MAEIIEGNLHLAFARNFERRREARLKPAKERTIGSRETIQGSPARTGRDPQEYTRAETTADGRTQTEMSGGSAGGAIWP